MMENPKRYILNLQVLDERFDNYSKSPVAGGLVEALTANRPLSDSDEAIMTSRTVNQIMAFVEFGLGEKDKTFTPERDIFAGLQEIIRACRCLSLRVEQFINIEDIDKG